MRRPPQTPIETQNRILIALKATSGPLTCVQLQQRGVGNYESILKAVRALESDGYLISMGKVRKYGSPIRWGLTLRAESYQTKRPDATMPQ